MAIIPTLTLSRAGELSRSWIPKNNKCPNSQRKKNSSWLVYVLHKMIIRHFHVVVVWWRQQNVQISVMHVQICCCSFDVLVAAVVDRILRSYFYYHCYYWYPLPVTSFITSTSTNTTTGYPLLATTNTTLQPLSPAPILSQTSVRSDVVTGCPHDRLSWERSLVKGSCASPNLPS